MAGTAKQFPPFCVVVAEKSYHSMAVVIRYNFNANTAYFDGIQLYKENFGSSYTYDEDGNVGTRGRFSVLKENSPLHTNQPNE